MTIPLFVERTRRWIIGAALFKAVAGAASVALLLMASLAFLGVAAALSTFAAAIGSVATVLLVVWQSKAASSVQNVALWVEETAPSLHYAIVTAATGNDSPALEKSVPLDSVQPLIVRRLTRLVLRVTLFLIVAAAAFALSPATAIGRGRVRSGLVKAFPGVVAPTDKISELRLHVSPPAYAQLKAFDQSNPSNLTVLSGSRIEVSGPGSPAGVALTIDGKPLEVKGNEDRWFSSLTASKQVAVIKAAHGSRSRVVVLEATPDRPPHVAFISPLRDTTLRTPQYRVTLSAETSDDFGLSTGYFEYLVVSGSGEAFNGRTLTSSPFRFQSRTGRLSAVLDFSRLKIVAGDMISVRAIVRDNNNLTGPSIGTSDTRTFRVARADEYDSVSIEAAAPPPVDSSAMSQRMLILMTEALVKKQKSLSRAQLVKESDNIGVMEDRIRKRVYDILYQTDSPEGAGDVEEAESELQAINNPDLKQAYDALWDAVRSLRIAEPSSALPPMRIALKALDRARLAQRVYLRGIAPKVVIDVQRVRLSGKEKGVSSVRTPQSEADSIRRILRSGFEAAVTMRKSNPSAAVEQLSLLRVRALSSAPEFAEALRGLIDAIQKNRNAGPALLQSRAALGTSLPAPTSLEWGGG